jgi:hypothetical protein
MVIALHKKTHAIINHAQEVLAALAEVQSEQEAERARLIEALSEAV